jgi:hypothetical protein
MANLPFIIRLAGSVDDWLGPIQSLTWSENRDSARHALHGFIMPDKANIQAQEANAEALGLNKPLPPGAIVLHQPDPHASGPARLVEALVREVEPLGLDVKPLDRLLVAEEITPEMVQDAQLAAREIARMARAMLQSGCEGRDGKPAAGGKGQGEKLISPTGTRQPGFPAGSKTTGKSRGRLEWEIAQSLMLARLTQGTLPKSIRDAAKAIGRTNSTTRKAVHETDSLKTHFGLSAENTKPSPGKLLEELASQSDARTRRYLQNLPQDKRKEVEA